MTIRIGSLTFDANDPLRLARFWAAALRWDIHDEAAVEVGLMPTDGTRFLFAFLPVSEPKTEKNPIHLDLVSESPRDQAQMVDRLTSLGAHQIDVGQGSDADHVVLSDPEGNEFCVVVRGEFLATTGLLGAIVFEPADYPTVGRFWSAALEWPIVYDRDHEIAIRHRSGRGPFITFGPSFSTSSSVKNRVHLDLAPHAGGDQQLEVDRLKGLGARTVDIGQGDVSWVVMADPQDNEFCVLTPR